jgi:hypothetical protein
MENKKKITLNELKTLVKKIIKEEVELNEYDRMSFNQKYQNLPKDKAIEINKFSADRQKLYGIKMVLKNDDTKIIYITPSDIGIHNFGIIEFDKNQLSEISKLPINGEITKEITFTVQNIVQDNGENNIWERFHIIGNFVKLTDKERPDFKLNVTSIKSNKDYIPQTPKDNVAFINQVKSTLLKLYNNKGEFPYITDVVIDRNAFYR